MIAKQTILIVDDIHANIVALQETLEDVDANIVTAKSGNEAVILAMELDLDLILMDVQMPDMDGFEAVTFIKKEPKNKYVPILFQTGISFEEKYIIKGLDCGAVDYITKPISSQILILKVKQFLEMQKNKKELSQTKALLFNIIDSTPDLICAKNKNLETILCNKAFAVSLGMRPEDVVGHSDEENGWTTLVEDEDKQGDEYLPHNELEVLDGKTIHIPCESINFKGKKRSFESYKVPLYDEKDNIIGLTSISRDITDKKVADLLAIEKAKADAANNTKSEFLANMSHEIRTPMNAIIGLCYLLLQSELTNKQYSYLQKIDLASHNLLGIINDILDFSKMESGKMVMEEIEFKMEEVLNNLATIVSAKVENKDLDIIFDIDSNIPDRLIGDPLRFGQILINIAGNAVKFTDRGSVVVKISVDTVDADAVRLLVSVKDTGIGMEPEQIAMLYQSFLQADSTITRRFGGTGLGLVISKNLIEQMGGTIDVNSQYGQGTEFYFTLPFKKIQECNTVDWIQRLPIDLSGLKMLAVDDSPVMRKILSKMLESFSFNVTTADSGEDALVILEAAAKDDPYKLVLIDWVMPGMSGSESIERILESKEINPKPKLIMLTNHSQDRLKNEVWQSKLDGFITKPITAPLLFDAIMDCFAKDTDFSLQQQLGPVLEQENLKKIAGANILLVEDNETNQLVASEILQLMGVNVTLAKDGLEALDKISTTDFDLVLMDIQMPNIDGIEATKRARKLKTSDELPILAMTAHAMIGDVEKSLRAGMNDHITKPIEPSFLFRLLLKWIKPKDRSPDEVVVKENSEKVEGQVFYLSKLKAVNCSNGLSRLGGSVAIYSKILRQFYYSHLDCIAKIRAALSENDKDAIGSIAHSVRGVAGNVGAMSLHEAAANLELKSRDNDGSECAEAVVLFESELNQVLDELKEFVRLNISVVPNVNEKAGDTKVLIAKLVEMETFVFEGQLKAAQESLDKLALGQWSAEINSKLKAIRSALDLFDVELTELLLKSLLEKCGNQNGQ